MRQITFKEYLLEVEAGQIDPKLDYHNELNPALWDNFVLRPEVETALNKIAAEFIEFLGVSKSAVTDVIITGSNANFNWVKKLSDIDLHLIVDVKHDSVCQSCSGDFVKDCFAAKKSLWNEEHDIKIHGSPVELYAQEAGEKLVAQGIYSLLQKKWLSRPSYKKPEYNATDIQSKAAELMNKIDELIDNSTDDRDVLQKLKDKLKQLRQAGLAKGGEFSVENLAWKALRNNGYLDKLWKYERSVEDTELSVK